jgi:adenine-specific DNA-methyltransferase
MVEAVENLRIRATAQLETDRRSELGQFMTPAPVAGLIAGMIRGHGDHIRILEPGAGVGSLIAAAVAELCSRPERPKRISVTAYELDRHLLAHLPETFEHCRALCVAAGVEFESEAIYGDFIERAVELLDGENDLFGETVGLRYDLVITNPPYKKLNTESTHRKLLRRVGIETSNLYTAFLGLAVKLLRDGGEMVAITPRSFCNGPYFRPFREFLLKETVVNRVHLFESRKTAFKDDAVLQENVIFQVTRGGEPGPVLITLGAAAPDAVSSERIISYDQLVWPGDPQSFIHIVPSDTGQDVADRMRRFVCTLDDLGIEVSTGRVVDFRAKDQLRRNPEDGAVPLIYPTHFGRGFIRWPIEGGRKPNALHVDSYTRPQLVPVGTYVLVKRFSAKEERRRIVATIFDPAQIPGGAEGVGFENKLNYFHQNGRGLDPQLAMGLSVFLNSTLVDLFFRQFSGHTQVNATDLRMLTYPMVEELLALGAAVRSEFPDQEGIDEIMQRELLARTPPGDA